MHTLILFLPRHVRSSAFAGYELAVDGSGETAHRRIDFEAGGRGAALRSRGIAMSSHDAMRPSASTASAVVLSEPEEGVRRHRQRIGRTSTLSWRTISTNAGTILFWGAAPARGQYRRAPLMVAGDGPSESVQSDTACTLSRLTLILLHIYIAEWHYTAHELTDWTEHSRL